ncbi:phosphotransferase [Bradyrhizobium canariense]|uniref:phosphotransferase n=1 Tax=Bradyrhizobium canariense TaxID=255045 RepID=UPI001CA4E859|nr:phosphotransferase [Bradyrhizobium canariense]MBW5435764.1 phosphotransferase [Bradyrhizobium canariense]
MMSDRFELDHLLETPPTEVSALEAADVLRRRYNLVGQVRTLSSERDANFRIDAPGGPYLLKITNPAEDPNVTDLQTAALRHLERESPSLPVPRIIATTEGIDQPQETFGNRPHVARLMSYMPGAPLGAAKGTSEIRSAVGTTLALIDAGLRTFEHPASDHDLLWNAADALRVRSAIGFVNDPEKRRLAEITLDEYEERAAPSLPRLRKQVIHNDFNPHNVLFESSAPFAISGVIDFGDIILAPLVTDVSTALAYQDYDGQSPVAVVSDVIRAYHRSTPLMSEELDVVLDLVRARQVLVGIISAWRAAHQPGNGTYILRNSARAWAGLQALHNVSRHEFRRGLMWACKEKPIEP